MTMTGDRPRARDLGLTVGVLPPGSLNAITDITGVRVGHSIVWEGESLGKYGSGEVSLGNSPTIKHSPLKVGLPTGVKS